MLVMTLVICALIVLLFREWYVSGGIIDEYKGDLRSAEQEVERLIVYSKQRFGEYADKLEAAEAELASERAISVALQEEIKLVRAALESSRNSFARKLHQSDNYAGQLDAIQEILNPSKDQT